MDQTRKHIRRIKARRAQWPRIIIHIEKLVLPDGENTGKFLAAIRAVTPPDVEIRFQCVETAK